MADINKKVNVDVNTAGGVAGLRALQGAFNGVLGVIGLVVAALVGLTFAAFKAGKEFIVFEKNVIKINVLLDKTERKAANVKGRLLELGKAVPTAEFSDLSDSVFTLQSELGDVEEAFRLAELAAKAGAATNTDTAKVTSALVTNIKNFNLTTEESIGWLDKYVNAVNSGVVTGEKLSTQIDEASIAMNSLGGSAGDTLAVFSAIGGALKEEQIKTGLKAINSEVIRNKDSFMEMGIATDDFNQMIIDLEGRDLAKIFGSVEAIQLLQTLIANRENYQDLVTEIENSEGVLADTFSAVEDSASFVFDAASASVDDFTIRAGEKFAEIGAAFIKSMDEAGIDEVFEEVLGLLADMTPVLVKIAEIIGQWIGDAVVTWAKELGKVSDILDKIQGDVSDTNAELSESEVFLNKILKSLNPLLAITEQFADVWSFIVGLLDVVVTSIQVIQEEIAGLTLFLELVKGGADIGTAFKTATKIKEQLKTQRILEGDFGDDELAARIAFEERLGKEAGEAYWDKWMEQRRLASKDMGPLLPTDTTVGGIGGDGDDGDGGDGAAGDGRTEREQREIDYLTARQDTRIADEEEITAIQTDGLDEVEGRRKEHADKRKEETKKAIEGPAKQIKDSLSTSIIKGIKDGNVLKALKDVFLVKLGDMVMKAIIDAVLAALASAIVMTILNLLTGGGAGAGQKAFSFAKGGYLQENKVHYAADGLFLANRTGANVLKHRPGGVPVVAAEAGVDEVNMFAPLNDTGFRLLMDKVMPLFPQFNQQMRDLGAIGSQAFISGARAQEAILSNAGNNLNVSIDPVIGPFLDVTISESAKRGNRLISERTVN